MATRRTSRFCWLIGAMGSNRLVARVHPVPAWLTRRTAFIVLEPTGQVA
jgi:hypothetical protein